MNIQNFLNASAGLIEEAMMDARKTDPEGLAGLSNVLRAGGLLTLRSTFAPSTGLAMIAVEISEPSGVVHTLMNAEIERKHL